MGFTTSLVASFPRLIEKIRTVDLLFDLRAGNDSFSSTNISENGVGILSSVGSGGLGDDLISGNATGVDGIGIADSLIYGGEGNDVIIATGTKAGIEGAILVGGAGDDTFFVQSGIGSVVGEVGDDLLILGGVKADYNFTPLDEVNTVINIEGSSNDTKLLVAQIEQFQFTDEPDVIFNVDDVFI